jgi:hypothetical protein
MQRKIHIPVMLVLFVTAAAIEAVRLTSLSTVSDGDLWWHLSSGLWILQNHALPHNGIYSQVVSSAWTPVSWLYDALLACLYREIDLRAIPALLMCFKVGLAMTTFMLAGGRRGNFWTAVILSAIAQYVLGGIGPSPVYFSVLFFGIELFLMFESRERPRVLYGLAPLFLVWANLDDQFVYGIGLMFVFVAAVAIGRTLGIKQDFSRSSGTSSGDALFPALKRWATSGRSSGASNSPSLLSVTVPAGLSLMASLITPFFYRPYATFIDSITGPAKEYLPDFKAMSFHQPQDYVLLLLTMAAFLALGRRQSRDAFQIVLLCLTTMLSFYAQRNVWMVALVAVAIIGDAVLTSVPQLSGDGSQVSDLRSQARETWAGSLAIALAGCALLAIIFLGLPRNRHALLAKVAESYPVGASNFIREHRLPQPLFNAYEWGGFLTWYLPQYPVAIDSRTDLYGDDSIILYSKAMNADVPYTAFPAMADARTLVFPKSSVLGEALSTVAGFKVAYSDDVGLVLTREDDAVAAK